MRKALQRELRAAILALLDARPPGASICPSAVARRVAGSHQWRDLLDPVRDAARRLAARGEVEMTQRGRTVDCAAPRGPIRLRRRRS